MITRTERSRTGPAAGRDPCFSVGPVPLLEEEYVRDIEVAPDHLLGLLRAELAKRPRRMFGVLKQGDEFIGVVEAGEFAVWERQQHATRAVGRVRGRRGGSRIEARIGVTRRTRVLMVIFFVLFGLGAYGVLLRGEGLRADATGIGFAIAAGVATLVMFWVVSLRQRARLRGFMDRVFRVPQGT